jgi:hypothetical protein
MPEYVVRFTEAEKDIVCVALDHWASTMRRTAEGWRNSDNPHAPEQAANREQEAEQSIVLADRVAGI